MKSRTFAASWRRLLRATGRESASGQRGQALVEFAVAAPLLIFLTLAVADVGRAFSYKEVVVNTARQAMRLAAANQSAGNTACAGQGNSQHAVQRNLPDSTGDSIANLINAAALETSTDGTPSTSVLNNAANPTLITITWNCLSSKAITNSTATSTDPASPSSDSVRVQIKYTFSLITPVSGASFPIRADVRGRLEY